MPNLATQVGLICKPTFGSQRSTLPIHTGGLLQRMTQRALEALKLVQLSWSEPKARAANSLQLARTDTQMNMTGQALPRHRAVDLNQPRMLGCHRRHGHVGVELLAPQV
ncbi:MAG: hypothetical protein C4K60_15375 [Ideonella sp. MAG2]|nr:MAG: hypothetical protein C4K60_15375 [Ideonella sp. MAG2]